MLVHQDFNHEILNEDEILKLFKNFKKGDVTARERLILHNLKLVLFIVRKFDNTGIEIEELVNIGTIGLIKAIDSFNLEKNTKFTTYSARCIENEILMYLRKIRKNLNNVSIHTVISENSDGETLKIEDKLIDRKPIAEEIVTTKASYEILHQIIEELPTQQREVVKLYFGFNSDKIYRQKEISEIIGLSRSRTSRIITSTVQKIKNLYFKNT